MSDNTLTDEWYALRVTYGREMKFKEHCDANNIINFIPLTYKTDIKNGEPIRKLEPVVRNLIFVKSNRELLDEIKLRFPIRYIIDRGTNEPITVPEKQLMSFIAVAGNYEHEIVFLDAEELKGKVGRRVRIVDGPFKGAEGTLIRVRNNKRVVVQLEGLMIVATHYVHPSLLEVVDE